MFKKTCFINYDNVVQQQGPLLFITRLQNNIKNTMCI